MGFVNDKPLVYFSAADFIYSNTELSGKITAIKAIISALELQALKMTERDGIDEYWLNDGQIQIKVKYKGVYAVQKSILSFQQQLNYYVNQAQGRIIRLRDGSNFPGNGRNSNVF